jgi:hypothetical protein
MMVRVAPCCCCLRAAESACSLLVRSSLTIARRQVGSNLNEVQLQQIVDKTILEADQDKDGKISFQEFVKVRTAACLIYSSVLSALIIFCSLSLPRAAVAVAHATVCR